MSNYRRWHHGDTYFFTVVTYQRRPILTTPQGRRALREAIAEVRLAWPFQIIAIVLLPDHLHTIWELPPEELDYSSRWRRIKSEFTRRWRKQCHAFRPISASRQRRGEHDVWQRRFFEHTVRDDRDLKRCVDYIHVNPLKHGVVTKVGDWPWSSFHRFVSEGEYTADWGSADFWYGDEFRHFE